MKLKTSLIVLFLFFSINAFGQDTTGDKYKIYGPLNIETGKTTQEMKYTISRYIDELLTVDKSCAENEKCIKALYEFFRSYAIVRKTFTGKDDPDYLFKRALEGMVNGLDSYSRAYIDDDAKEFFSAISEIQRTGPGFSVARGKDSWIIVDVVPGTQAEKEGLSTGDVILEIDGQPVKNLLVDEILALVFKKGEKGEAAYKVASKRYPQEVKIYKIRNAEYIKPNVIAKAFGNILYVRIYSFFDASEKFLEILKSSSARNLVLDLRNCPGGDIDEVKEIASRLIGGGKILTWQERKNGNLTYHEIQKPDFVRDFSNIIILANKKTASGGELLIGALKFFKKATVIGETTYGKGTFQNWSDNDPAKHEQKESHFVLMLTAGKYYLPDGKNLSSGIPPDMEIKAPDLKEYFFGFLEKDTQLQAALKLLSGKHD